MLTSTTFHSKIQQFMLRSISPFDNTDEKCENRTSITRKLKITYRQQFFFLLATIIASIWYTVSSYSNQIDNDLFFRHSTSISNSVFTLFQSQYNHFSVRGKKINPIITVATCRVNTEHWTCMFLNVCAISKRFSRFMLVLFFALNYQIEM